MKLICQGRLMQVIPKMENKRAKQLHHPLLKALQTLKQKGIYMQRLLD